MSIKTLLRRTKDEQHFGSEGQGKKAQGGDKGSEIAMQPPARESKRTWGLMRGVKKGRINHNRGKR